MPADAPLEIDVIPDAPASEATDGHAEWTSYLSGNDAANLYHTLAWRDLVREVFGHRPVFLAARADGRVVGALPMFIVRAPLLGAKALSLPYEAGSGGPLADDPGVALELAGRAAVLAERMRAKHLEIRTTRELPGIDGLGFTTSLSVVHSEVRLDDGPAVWDRVARDQRKSMEKAERRGVRVRAAEDERDFQAFYRVYLEAFRDFGTPPYGRSYVNALRRRLHPEGLVRVLLAEVDGAAVGGLVLFLWGTNAVSKFAVVRSAYTDHRVFPALYGRALEECLDLGCRRLSWGTAAASQTGLIAFKERWAAESERVRRYVKAIRGEPKPLDDYYDDSGLARRVWRRLPVRLTPVLGHPLNRWFA